MKNRMIFFLLLMPVFGNAQTLIKCNDTTSYFVNQNENLYCYIKLTGQAISLGNGKVVGFKNLGLQALLVEKKHYLSEGKTDTSVLKNYMISETNYYAVSFKENLKTMMIPIELSNEKKALIWYFDIPETIQKQRNPGETYCIRQVFISQVIGNYVYSLVTTQFNNQPLDGILRLLTDLSKTIKSINGKIEQTNLCD